MKTPTRPILRYFGGKWKLGPWIIEQFPEHDTYVELFGGAASVLLQKRPSRQEVYNDLDEHIVGIFRVLRDKKSAERLIYLLETTPYSRKEYEEAYKFKDETDPVEKARKIISLSFMAYSTDSVTRGHKTGFRAGASRKRFQPACHDWANFPPHLIKVVERLKRVIIEHRDWKEVLELYDASNTLFYADPPYPHDTRYDSRGYNFELSSEQHKELLGKLSSAKGMIAISTYANPLYEQILGGVNGKK